MKKALLSCVLFASALLSHAQQPVPVLYNFNNGAAPVGWTLPGSFTIGAYRYNSGSGCVDGIGITQTTLRQSGSSRVLTNEYQAINANSLVTLAFDLWVLNNANNCSSPIALPCSSTTVTAYVVSTDFLGNGLPSSAQIYGQQTIQVTANQSNSIPISITQNFAGARNFKVFVVATTGNCTGGNNPVTYVIDNVAIIESPEAPLPVTFKVFNAERKGVDVSLTWTTASEQNNKGFYIQRKTGGEWQTIAFVASQSNGGNSSTELKYEFQDANPEKGISQYRVQQVDIDGKSLFSIIRAVRGQEQFSKIVVYPNPSNGAFSVMFNDLQAKDVQLSDASGRILSRYTNVFNNIEVKGLKSGLYNVHVTDRVSGVKTILKAVVQ